jgi:anti-sigma B factor antagonist
MVVSSRTPEGQPNHCPVCGSQLRIEPSDPAGDAPCPRCGHLVWFAWQDSGDVQVIRPTDRRLDSGSLDRLIDSLGVRSGLRLVIDMSEVQYLDSAALSKLIELRRRLRGSGGRLRLQHVQSDLAGVFRMTGLDRVFDIDP